MTEKSVPDHSAFVLSTAFKPVSAFAACLRGVDAIEIGLHRLATAVGAQSILLSRLSSGHRTAVVAAKSTVAKPSLVELNRPFCDNILDIDPWKLQVGVCVFRSGLDQPQEPSRSALERWDRVSGTRDSLVMVLEINKDHVDRIEMHFDHRVERDTIHLCEEIARVLPMFYLARVPDIIEDSISRNAKRTGAAPARKGRPILSATNPYNLTRSEFRLCHVISRGLSYKALPAKLEISPHTVRSHLRNIYGKLEVEDYYELSHRLVSIEERMEYSTPFLQVS